MSAETGLEPLVAEFAQAWLRIADAAVGAERVADPILVLGAEGTSAVPREAFLAAVRGRAAAVAATATITSLTSSAVTPLGDRMALATLTWSFGDGPAAPRLVGDFLLQREEGGLRCVAYLPRTTVLDHLPT